MKSQHAIISNILEKNRSYVLPAPHTVCPRCGSDLVERTVKDTGTIFLGCSSYPKCKFSKDIQVPYEKSGPVSIWVVIFVLAVILVLLTN